VFASRDLKANEEVVRGWEWDDGNAVHNLPALNLDRGSTAYVSVSDYLLALFCFDSWNLSVGRNRSHLHNSPHQVKLLRSWRSCYMSVKCWKNAFLRLL